MENEIFDINNFNEYKEDNRREVKKAREGLPSSIWETYSSFANCYGGVIILGVDEKADGTWETTAIGDADKLLKDFWNTINNPSKVSLNILKDNNIKLFTLNGDNIIVINVPAAKREQKPIYINADILNGTFRRNGDGDYHCTKAEIQGMLRDAAEESPDMKVLDNFDIKVLSKEAVQSYRNCHKSYKPGHVFEKLSDNEFLERIGAASYDENKNCYHPTAAGLLMFGEEYKIVREFPEYFLDYREMLDPTTRWSDRLQSSSGDWSGNLLDFFFRVNNKLSKDIKVPFVLDGITRVEDTPVHKAIREALVNCLVNADYYMPCGVVVKKENEKVTFENPGSIMTGKKQMLRGGISNPRNKALMKMFNLIGFGERAGSGVPNIFQVWNDAGWIEPVVEEEYSPDRTILLLSFEEKTAKEIPFENIEGRIIECMSENPKITISGLCRINGDFSYWGMQYHVNALKKKGLVIHEGPTKGGRWIVKENTK